MSVPFLVLISFSPSKHPLHRPIGLYAVNQADLDLPLLVPKLLEISLTDEDDVYEYRFGLLASSSPLVMN